MSDVWSSAALAAGFHLLEGVTEREVGFPSLFSKLGLGTPAVRRVLDYGCGTGRAAHLIAERYGVIVTAVDVSPAMLRLARRDHHHPKVEHRLLGEERLGFLADGSIDAAMSCFVFINIAEETELAEIAADVRRVLRSGGRYVIMDSNPEATGIRFGSFRTGEPGRRYDAGEQRPVQLYNVDGHTIELTDYHWPTATYERILRDAGFRTVRMCQPTLKQNRDRPAAEPPAEAMHPPLLLVTAEK
jgi:ubiquinone/menaquinone biosynthesis C-methylase UbiE